MAALPDVTAELAKYWVMALSQTWSRSRTLLRAWPPVFPVDVCQVAQITVVKFPSKEL
jgi:hypothetical protein